MYVSKKVIVIYFFVLFFSFVPHLYFKTAKHATQNFNPNFARQLITTWRLALICQNRLSSITAHLSKVKIERKGPHTVRIPAKHLAKIGVPPT